MVNTELLVLLRQATVKSQQQQAILEQDPESEKAQTVIRALEKVISKCCLHREREKEGGG